jgi:microtubule-associated protein-like 6
MGIWPDNSNGTDVNAVHMTRREDLVVTCDDFGRVKLFNAPCVVEDAPFREYRGHSSHVMNVRFLTMEETVISCGGLDHAAFQWRVVPGGSNKSGALQGEGEDPLDKTRGPGLGDTITQ